MTSSYTPVVWMKAAPRLIEGYSMAPNQPSLALSPAFSRFCPQLISFQRFCSCSPANSR